MDQRGPDRPDVQTQTVQGLDLKVDFRTRPQDQTSLPLGKENGLGQIKDQDEKVLPTLGMSEDDARSVTIRPLPPIQY